MSYTMHCPKYNQEQEFPPTTSFICCIVTAGLFGEMFKPLFRRREGCGFRCTDALTATNRQGDGE